MNTAAQRLQMWLGHLFAGWPISASEFVDTPGLDKRVKIKLHPVRMFGHATHFKCSTCSRMRPLDDFGPLAMVKGMRCKRCRRRGPKRGIRR